MYLLKNIAFSLLIAIIRYLISSDFEGTCYWDDVVIKSE